MAPNDTINLCKDQWIEVRAGTDGRRLIVDHPLNALLVGVRGPATVVRSSDFALEPGDSTVSIYATKAGMAHRAATAVVRERKSGALFLADWRLQPSFALESEGSNGHRTHRIVPSRIDCAASILAEMARGPSADEQRKSPRKTVTPATISRN